MLVVLLITHITIALASLVLTTLTAFMPSKSRIKFSGVLIGLTLISGTALVIVSHSPILSSCLAGLAYLAVAMIGVIVGVKRLAKKAIALE